MPCQAEEVLKAPVGQPAFQQLNGATALYCLPAPRLLCRRLAARYSGGAPPGMLPSPLIGELALRILARQRRLPRARAKNRLGAPRDRVNGFIGRPHIELWLRTGTGCTDSTILAVVWLEGGCRAKF